MTKTLKISEETHHLLTRVLGEYTSKLGKRMTMDETISELIREHFERESPAVEPKAPAEKTGFVNNYEIIWDGRDSRGSYVKNDIYIAYFDAGSKLKRQSRTITVNKYPLLTNFLASPNPFSPNGDLMDDLTVISFDTSDDSLLTLKIYNDFNQELVRTLGENTPIEYGHQSFTWDGLDDLGQALNEGRYTARISIQSIFGGEINTVNLNIYLRQISNINICENSFDPSRGESCLISYTLSTDAIISINMYDSQDNLVRQLMNEVPRSPGSYQEIWNGRDDAGQIVPDGYYYFVITDSIQGEPIVVFDPRGTGGQDISHSISLLTTPFDASKNIPCILTYNMSQSAKINLKVRESRYDGPAVKVIEYEVPRPQGQYTSVWDGRNELGEIVPYRNYTFAIWGYTLPDKAIIVVGQMPVIDNSITVDPLKFSPENNPYSNSPRLATITYGLLRACKVTMNIYDSNNNLVRNLITSASRNAGTNSELWDGKTSGGVFVQEGEYRIDIQAENNGNYSLVRSATVFIHY
ncbi:MAG: hypothetical protein HY606_15120 [Planctomycetes bacterium]|nr:hypothetical protein [Planctomycetota bacterium]